MRSTQKGGRKLSQRQATPRLYAIRRALRHICVHRERVAVKGQHTQHGKAKKVVEERRAKSREMLGWGEQRLSALAPSDPILVLALNGGGAPTRLLCVQRKTLIAFAVRHTWKRKGKHT